MRQLPPGIASAVVAFTLWGVLPAFWKQFEFMPPVSIVAHRTIWGMILLVVCLAWRRDFPLVIPVFARPRLMAWHLLSGLLLAGNWLLYIWATLNDRVLEGALGYYLNPFFNILFGMLWFGERHSRRQLQAVVLALAGVAIQIPGIQGIPWVALALALSFSLYAVVKKRAPLPSLPGLSVETALMLPLAVAWICLHPAESIPGPDAPAIQWLLVTGAGIATVMPLLFFGHAARTISLTTLGILQFIGPSLQFVIGWLVYKEEMNPFRLLSFALIWLAIGLYARDALRSHSTSGG